MPISNDNQDYGQSDEKNKQNNTQESSAVGESKLTSDDLKGKKIDADLERSTDKPAEQEQK